jgi:hypothetical protein
MANGNDSRKGNFNEGGYVENQISNEGSAAPQVKWAAPTVTRVGASYRTVYDLEVVSDFPVNAIWFEVYGENVRELDIIQQRTGLQMVGWSGVRETHSFTTIEQAYGRYKLRVMSDNEKVEIKYGFE